MHAVWLSVSASMVALSNEGVVSMHRLMRETVVKRLQDRGEQQTWVGVCVSLLEGVAHDEQSRREHQSHIIALNHRTLAIVGVDETGRSLRSAAAWAAGLAVSRHFCQVFDGAFCVFVSACRRWRIEIGVGRGVCAQPAAMRYYVDGRLCRSRQCRPTVRPPCGASAQKPTAFQRLSRSSCAALSLVPVHGSRPKPRWAVPTSSKHVCYITPI